MGEGIGWQQRPSLIDRHDVDVTSHPLDEPKCQQCAPAHDNEVRGSAGGRQLLAKGKEQLVLPQTIDSEFLSHARCITSRIRMSNVSPEENAAGFLACRHEDDAIVGVFTLGQIVRGPLQSAYLGFYGFSPFEGQGYMTEAMRLVLRHAFGAMKLHRVEANIQPGNAASIALVRRCGFRLEGFSPRYLKISGRWRDHERWAILAEECVR